MLSDTLFTLFMIFSLSIRKQKVFFRLGIKKERVFNSLKINLPIQTISNLNKSIINLRSVTYKRFFILDLNVLKIDCTINVSYNNLVPSRNKT